MSDLTPFYAYGPKRVPLEAVMRLSAVKRWHMLDTSRQQTLAEHSANVAALVYLIAVTTPGMFFGHSEAIAAQALLHDMGEVFSGDIPTPTKAFDGVRDIVNGLERELVPPMFHMKPTERARLLIKICDLVDGIRFIRLHGVDITSRHARVGLEAQLAKRMGDMWEWPVNVRTHVADTVMFYAYEDS